MVLGLAGNWIYDHSCSSKEMPEEKLYVDLLLPLIPMGDPVLDPPLKLDRAGKPGRAWALWGAAAEIHRYLVIQIQHNCTLIPWPRIFLVR